jgi:hypothetical protein
MNIHFALPGHKKTARADNAGGKAWGFQKHGLGNYPTVGNNPNLDRTLSDVTSEWLLAVERCRLDAFRWGNTWSTALAVAARLDARSQALAISLPHLANAAGIG